MTRDELRTKIAGMISNIDEIILCRSEQVCGIEALKKCKDDLQEVLHAIDVNDKMFDVRQVVPIARRLLDCLYLWITGDC